MTQTPGFAIFGSVDFVKSIKEAEQNQTLFIQRTSSDTSTGQLRVNKELKGSVIMNVDHDRAYFIVYEQEDKKNGNSPWEYKEPHFNHSLYLAPEKDSLYNFKTFIKFMLDFESFLREKIRNKYGVDLKGDSLPEGFFGILQYEFFRQISTFTTRIEAGIAFPDSIGSKVVFVMLRVIGDESNKEDVLEFSDFIELEGEA